MLFVTSDSVVYKAFYPQVLISLMRFLLFTMIVEHFVPLKQLIKSTLCPLLISFKVPSYWHGNQSVQTSRSDAVVDIRKEKINLQFSIGWVNREES